MPTAAPDREAPPTVARWQRELADAIRDPVELCRVLGLDPAQAVAGGRAAETIPLHVPR
jgi:L-lysine 2,3-aminomutase